jgi:glycosyltransferase involved in cell wall biosynthesis
MRICLLADGESIHTVRWCQQFHEFGHDVHLITFKNVKIPNIHVHYIEGVDIHVSGGNWKVALKYLKVKQIIKSINPQVLHALYATSYGLLGALSGFHPYIVTPLGSDVLISPKQSVIYRFILKYVFKSADIITSMAPHMKESMLELGSKNEKIKDIMFGINTDIFNKNKRSLSTTDFVICSSRNFEPVYNIPHFLRSIAIIKGKIPHLKVNIIGDGSLKENLIQLSKELQIDDVVRFYGKVPQSEVVSILNQANVFVTVSLSDGNSLSLIEAMACGAYPVATDILANKQWITDHENGRFVTINDVNGLAECLLDIYKNYSVIIDKAILESDRLITEKGTWQINMAKMNKIYESLNKN